MRATLHGRDGPGFVDCDGGSNVDVSATVDSNGTAAPPAPTWDDAWVTAPSGGSDSGAGAALIPISGKVQQLGAGPCPGPGDASWDAVTSSNTYVTTGSATALVTDARKCPGGGGLAPSCPNPPYQVTLSGVNLSCASWTTQTARAMAAPLFFLDSDFGANPLGGTFGVGDMAIVGRLNTMP